MRSGRLNTWLVALVIVHLAVSLVHGMAHAGARVGLTPAANAFVIIVILLGPLVGLLLSRFYPRYGAGLVAACMAAALLFGVINHFLRASPDHVLQVDAEWRFLFGSTALLLALIEAGGTLVAALVASTAREASA